MKARSDIISLTALYVVMRKTRRKSLGSTQVCGGKESEGKRAKWENENR